MRIFLGPPLALLVSLVLVGCSAHPPEREDEMKSGEQFDALSKRPDLEEASKRYDGIHAEVLAKLADEFDLPEWEPGGVERGMSQFCGDFPDVDSLDAGTYETGSRVAEGDIVPHWDKAVDVVRHVGAKYGFTTVTLDADGGDHRIFELADGLGAKLYVGSAGNTNVSITSGCHLTAEAKQRGRPITEEEAEEELWGTSVAC